MTSTVLQAETLDTRIGKLEFTQDFADGYPTDATVKKLFEVNNDDKTLEVHRGTSSIESGLFHSSLCSSGQRSLGPGNPRRP